MRLEVRLRPHALDGLCFDLVVRRPCPSLSKGPALGEGVQSLGWFIVVDSGVTKLGLPGYLSMLSPLVS
jgi:hypothetical protein